MQSVTNAVTVVTSGASAYANAAIPGVSAVAIAFVGIAICWLLLKTLRKAAGGSHYVNDL